MKPAEAAAFQYEFFKANPGLRPSLELMSTAPNACFFVKDLESRYVMGNAFHLVTYDLTDDLGPFQTLDRPHIRDLDIDRQ